MADDPASPGQVDPNPVAPETKPAEAPPVASTTPETAPTQPPAESKPVVPEKYELKVPEGVQLDEGARTEFEAHAKELGLSQDKAQKLIDLAAKNNQQQFQKFQEAWDKQRLDWVNALEHDADFGGDRFKETISRAQRILKNFGSDDLKNFCDKTGFGDNKDLIIMLAKIDKAIGEDLPVEGAPAEKFTDAASILYGNK